MARSQMTEIVTELGTVGLPSILRIDTYFEILLGQHPTRNFDKVQFDPDKIGGTLGELRSTYGIKFRGNPFNNSIEDEQDITNFRVISDYMTSFVAELDCKPRVLRGRASGGSPSSARSWS